MREGEGEAEADGERNEKRQEWRKKSSKLEDRRVLGRR
jgi:hypothetical protein